MHRRPSTNVTKFTAIAVNGFYTMTRSGLMTTADSDSPENIQCDELRTLAADEKAMKELYAQAEVLQTATQPKRLVVYKEYLLWFRDLPTNDEPRVPDSASTPHKGTLGAEALTSCSTSKASSPKRNTPVLEGYANIRGMYVESNHSTKIQTMDRDTLTCLRLLSHRTNHAAECLYLAAGPQADRWRARLASCPVVFADFATKYRCVAEVSADSHLRVSVVRDQQHGTTLLCKSRRLFSADSDGAKTRLTAECVREAAIQLALQGSQVAAEFVELQSDGESVHLLERQLDATRLSDWFDCYWQPETLDPVAGQVATLHLLVVLAELVEALHQLGVTHGSVGRDTVLANHHCGLAPDAKTHTSHSAATDQRSQRVALWWGSLRTCQHHPHCPDWSAVRCSRDFPEVPLEEPVARFWAESAADVKELGVLWYEVVFGVCIPKILGHAGSWDGDFVGCLLARPHEYVGQREALHAVGEEVTGLIAKMLDPDWKQRPLIVEVVQILQSLLVEFENSKSSDNLKNRKVSHFQSLGRSQLQGSLSLFRTEYMADQRGGIPREGFTPQTGPRTINAVSCTSKLLMERPIIDSPLRLRNATILKPAPATLNELLRNEQEFSALRTVRPGGSRPDELLQHDRRNEDNLIKASVRPERVKGPGALLSLCRLNSLETIEQSRTLRLTRPDVKTIIKGSVESRSKLYHSAYQKKELHFIKPKKVETEYVVSDMNQGDISFSSPPNRMIISPALVQSPSNKSKVSKTIKMLDHSGCINQYLRRAEPHILPEPEKPKPRPNIPILFMPEVLRSGRIQFSPKNKLTRVTLPTTDLKTDVKQSNTSWRTNQGRTIVAYRDLIPRTPSKDLHLGVDSFLSRVGPSKIETQTRSLEKAETAAETPECFSNTAAIFKK